MDGMSLTPEQEKLNALRNILPEAFCEGKIDWEKLKATLGGDINFSNERYVLNWAGKSDAFKILQTPTYKTLIPAKDESVNFDETNNIFIEGENLEVLKVLQKSYFGKVKMIYIDPPYNTGNDSFIYPDMFSESKADYEKRVGDKDEEGYMTKSSLKSPSLGGVSQAGWSKNSKENGQYHSNWLNMMMPRLYLAKNLLRQDGVIFVSFDDNEVHNLRLLMNEIFGEENFLGCLPTIMNLKGNNDQFGFSGTHEYTLVFLKDYNLGRIGEFKLDEIEIEKWEEDEYGLYKQGANLKSTGVNAPREKRPNLYFPIYVNGNVFSLENKDGFEEIFPTTNKQEMSWRWSKTKFQKEFFNVIISKNGNEYSIYKKQRPEINDLPSKKPKSIFYKPSYSSGNGTQELKNIFNERYFSNPKPINLVKDFIEIGTHPNDLILDFFSGSGTTAHSVMELNKEDGGNRKYICVQLPELCEEKSEAFKAGYKTIAEISKERIRRAGKKINDEIRLIIDDLRMKIKKLQSELPTEENQSEITSLQSQINNLQSQDLGFKVLKLEDSNFKQWQQIEGNDAQALAEQMKLFVDPVSESATIENMVYELLLKSGKDLNSKIFPSGGGEFGYLLLCD